MKFYVNDNCIGCGLCAGLCPDVFEMTSEGVSHVIGKADTPELEKRARQALEECPVDAIEER
ncbi:MAG: ferredoxin [Oscillospiraceae bacterium]|nr:ferredoxin [Oscillospiraceae bacterium]MDD6502892.1 ferredoxin [Oscillospiraceae bacterium]MDY4104963.1 ferredoxin [Oscillospiraceae bacterium]